MQLQRMNMYFIASLWICLSISCLCAFEIRIDTSRIVHEVDERFVSVAIDSGVIRRHWDKGKFNPRSIKVHTLAAALSPCYLRMGGTDADFLIFDNGTSGTAEYWPKHEAYPLVRPRRDIGLHEGTNPKDWTNFTMSAEMFDEINQFSSGVGWDLLFDVNLLLRRNGHWDPTNAIKLMKYTADKGYKMAGWELGNEPDDMIFAFNITMDPRVLAEDFFKFHDVVRNFTQFKNSRIIGPSVVQNLIISTKLVKFRLEPEQLARDFITFNKTLKKFMEQTTRVLGPSITQLKNKHTIDFFKRFFEAGGGKAITSATFHQYYFDGRTATLDQFMDPAVMNVLRDEVDIGVSIANNLAPHVDVWLGETSSAYGGGAKGLSDRYVAGFLWLDKLGIAAKGGVDVAIRQSFYGGDYALLDAKTSDPTPDYWLSLLFKQLVGRKVLDVTSPDGTGKLRAYAHCVNTDRSGYKVGGVVVYVLNLNNTIADVTFPDIHPAGDSVDQYMLISEDYDLTATIVTLNGLQRLEMVDDRTLPKMLPMKTTLPLFIPPNSFGFFVFPNANVKVCIT